MELGVLWIHTRCIDFPLGGAERGENPFDMPTPWIFPKWNEEMSSAAIVEHRGNFVATLEWGQTEI